MYPRNSSATSLNRSQSISKLLAPLMLASAAIFHHQAVAQAANFNFSYAPGTSLNQMIGFEIAGGIWSRHLADPVTINLYVQTTNDLPSGVIGGALPGVLARQRYESLRKSLANDRKSADDELAFRNLPSSDDDGFTVRINNKKVKENETLRMIRTNAKALGILNRSGTGLDGAIVINNLSGQPIRWNYDFLNNPVPTNTLDFLSVGLHEIGHNLGFVSGVDKPGLLTSNGSGDDDDDSASGADNPTPLDLFRYSKASAALGIVDLSTGGDSFFSVDRGKTILGHFATGVDTTLGGDGEQASHWKQQDTPSGIMDPILAAGQRKSISTLDLQVMDAIGWDLQQFNIDLVVLQQQAKERLAARLGVTVAWLDANPELAAALLANDRTSDVEAMIEQSQIYNWRSGSSVGWWQVGLWQRFSKQDNSTMVASYPQAVAVPVPSLLPGLLVGGGLSRLRALRKRRSQKRVTQP